MLESTQTTAYGTSLVKAFTILSFLSRQENPKNVTEIANKTNMSKSTAFKLLETLQTLELVERDHDAPVYRLGIGVVKLAHNYLSDRNPLSRIAQPYLERLNQETGETVHLGIMQGTSVVYLSKLESRQIVRMHSSEGSQSPLYCTGLGKALLATLEIEQLSTYLSTAELMRYTPHTIIDKHQLISEVEKIRKLGYSIDNAEHSTDVRCVAVALVGRHKVYGAVSISAPEYRMEDEKVAHYVALLNQVKENILSTLE